MDRGNALHCQHVIDQNGISVSLPPHFPQRRASKSDLCADDTRDWLLSCLLLWYRIQLYTCLVCLDQLDRRDRREVFELQFVRDQLFNYQHSSRLGDNRASLAGDHDTLTEPDEEAPFVDNVWHRVLVSYLPLLDYPDLTVILR